MESQNSTRKKSNHKTHIYNESKRKPSGSPLAVFCLSGQMCGGAAWVDCQPSEREREGEKGRARERERKHLSLSLKKFECDSAHHGAFPVLCDCQKTTRPLLPTAPLLAPLSFRFSSTPRKSPMHRCTCVDYDVHAGASDLFDLV